MRLAQNRRMVQKCRMQNSGKYNRLVLYPFHFNTTNILQLTLYRNYVGKVTGGVYASLEIMSVKPEGQDDETKVLPGVNMLTMLFIRGKCTEERIPDLFDVFGKVLDEINFDDSQSILQNALKSNLSSKKGSVASRGHSFANQRIRGRYSVRGKSCMYYQFLYSM